MPIKMLVYFRALIASSPLKERRNTELITVTSSRVRTCEDDPTLRRGCSRLFALLFELRRDLVPPSSSDLMRAART